MIRCYNGRPNAGDSFTKDETRLGILVVAQNIVEEHREETALALDSANSGDNPDQNAESWK